MSGRSVCINFRSAHLHAALIRRYNLIDLNVFEGLRIQIYSKEAEGHYWICGSVFSFQNNLTLVLIFICTERKLR